VFPICLYIIATDDKLASDAVWADNAWSKFCFALGVGYFTSDAFVVMRYRIEPIIPIMCHHVFAGYGFLVCISEYGKATWYPTLLLCTEATALWNNTHWKLLKCKMGETAAAKFSGLMLTITWFVFRILLNPYLYWKLWVFWEDVMAMGMYLKFWLFINVAFLSLLNNYWFFAGPFWDLARLRVPADAIITADDMKGTTSGKKKN